jgi:predicted phage terminase large subunit-like protein
MNIPFSPSDRKYQPRWFIKVPDEMIPGQHPPFSPLHKWIAVDTALKDDEHPSGYDYNVVVVGGFDDLGRLYILDIFRDKDWTAKQVAECVTTCAKTAEYGGISQVIIEKVGEAGFGTYVKEHARIKGATIHPTFVTRGGRSAKSKMDRILGCQGYFEQGRVFFRKTCENYEDTVNEFCNLGRWTNDDIADAISMFFDEQVKVLAPRRDAPATIAPFLRPMPFDGMARRAAFATTQTNKPNPYNFGRNGQVAVGPDGDPLFTPAQVELFATRSDKKQAPPQPAFRMFR